MMVPYSFHKTEIVMIPHDDEAEASSPAEAVA
jgi:hypothetical protein